MDARSSDRAAAAADQHGGVGIAGALVVVGAHPAGDAAAGASAPVGKPLDSDAVIRPHALDL
jgi:hypothetical protein